MPPHAVSDVFVLSDLICPISKQLLDDPVVAADGYTYSRRCIEDHFVLAAYNDFCCSPRTGKVLPTRNVTPNITIQAAVARYKISASLAQPCMRWGRVLQSPNSSTLLKPESVERQGVEASSNHHKGSLMQEKISAKRQLCETPGELVAHKQRVQSPGPPAKRLRTTTAGIVDPTVDDAAKQGTRADSDPSVRLESQRRREGYMCFKLRRLRAIQATQADKVLRTDSELRQLRAIQASSSAILRSMEKALSESKPEKALSESKPENKPLLLELGASRTMTQCHELGASRTMTQCELGASRTMTQCHVPRVAAGNTHFQQRRVDNRTLQTEPLVPQVITASTCMSSVNASGTRQPSIVLPPHRTTVTAPRNVAVVSSTSSGCGNAMYLTTVVKRAPVPMPAVPFTPIPHCNEGSQVEIELSDMHLEMLMDYLD